MLDQAFVWIQPTVPIQKTQTSLGPDWLRMSHVTWIQANRLDWVGKSGRSRPRKFGTSVESHHLRLGVATGPDDNAYVDHLPIAHEMRRGRTDGHTQ